MAAAARGRRRQVGAYASVAEGRSSLHVGSSLLPSCGGWPGASYATSTACRPPSTPSTPWQPGPGPLEARIGAPRPEILWRLAPRAWTPKLRLLGQRPHPRRCNGKELPLGFNVPPAPFWGRFVWGTAGPPCCLFVLLLLYLGRSIDERCCPRFIHQFDRAHKID